MLPVLRVLSDGQTRYWRELLEPVAVELAVADEDNHDTLPSGQSRFENRVQW